MRRLLLGALAVYGVFFALGYTWAEHTAQIRLSPHVDATTRFSVIATLPAVTPDHAWLEVTLCAAELDATATAHCLPDGWWTSAGQQPSVQQGRQYEIPFGRSVPRGTKLIQAAVIDRRLNVLATGRKVVLR